jgi:DNA-directed RNA polymerase subunit RPC12/RpoP
MNDLTTENIQQTKETINGKVFYNVICVYCGKRVTYPHSKKPTTCPFCHSKDFRKPATETHLFLLQNKYLQTRDKKYLGEMFILLKNYASSIIKKMLPRSFIYHYDKVEEKASDAASYLIEYFLTKPNFKIEMSFAGYLRWKIKQVLFNKKEQLDEKNVSSYNALFSTDNKDLIDISEIIKASPISKQETEYYNEEQTKTDLIEGIEKLIDRIIYEIRTQYSFLDALIILMGLCLKIENKKNIYFDKIYSLFVLNIKNI